MNYRHLYHAGNFADVLKHSVLTLLIQTLKCKDTAFCYLDTHAGSGLYHLQSTTAQKTQEYKSGIELLLSEKNPPDILNEYLNYIHLLNENSTLNLYPGSPLIVRNNLRSQDRMILCELHPQEIGELKNLFASDRQVAVHHTDGFQAIKAFLPPKERRGLVLIDPPYEKNDEWQKIILGLQMGLKRWKSGIYAVWYPIKERRLVQKFYSELKKIAIENILVIELILFPDDIPTRLNGCGMVILNPPWQFEQKINSCIEWLWTELSPVKLGKYRVERKLENLIFSL